MAFGVFAARSAVQALEDTVQARGMPATVRVNGQVVADVSAGPESVVFEAKPVGERSVVPVTLRRRSGSLFRNEKSKKRDLLGWWFARAVCSKGTVSGVEIFVKGVLCMIGAGI